VGIYGKFDIITHAKYDLRKGVAMTEDSWLSVEDVAGRLGVTARTVRGWLSRGVLTGYRFGGVLRGTWKVKPEDLERFIADSRNQPA
jgi:excisionase family DNA binding protein